MRFSLYLPMTIRYLITTTVRWLRALPGSLSHIDVGQVYFPLSDTELVTVTLFQFGWRGVSFVVVDGRPWVGFEFGHMTAIWLGPLHFGFTMEFGQVEQYKRFRSELNFRFFGSLWRPSSD